jgi:hypothetical protein
MNKSTFPYHDWKGAPVEAEGYSEYEGTTKDYKGESLYKYVFIIRDIHTDKVLYTLDYTGTVPPCER